MHTFTEERHRHRHRKRHRHRQRDAHTNMHRGAPPLPCTHSCAQTFALACVHQGGKCVPPMRLSQRVCRECVPILICDVEAAARLRAFLSSFLHLLLHLLLLLLLLLLLTPRTQSAWHAKLFLFFDLTARKTNSYKSRHQKALRFCVRARTRLLSCSQHLRQYLPEQRRWKRRRRRRRRAKSSFQFYSSPLLCCKSPPLCPLFSFAE